MFDTTVANNQLLQALKLWPWVGEMAQGIKTITAKFGDMSLISRANMVEGKNQLLQIVL